VDVERRRRWFNRLLPSLMDVRRATTNASGTCATSMRQPSPRPYAGHETTRLIAIAETVQDVSPYHGPAFRSGQCNAINGLEGIDLTECRTTISRGLTPTGEASENGSSVLAPSVVCPTGPRLDFRDAPYAAEPDSVAGVRCARRCVVLRANMSTAL